MRSILFLIVFWGYLIICTPVLIYITILEWLGRPDETRRLAGRQSMHWGRFMLKTTGSTVEHRGLDKMLPEGGVVIVANHQGAFDIPLMLGYLERPIAFVAKQELKKIPLMGRWMLRMGCQLLDRSNRRQGLEIFKQSTAFLNNGGALIIFPEGTRSRGGPLADFKKGSLRMALKAGIPVIPVTIVDSYRIWEGNHGWIKPATVKIIINDPIVTAGMSKEEQINLTDRVRDIIATNLAENEQAKEK